MHTPMPRALAAAAALALFAGACTDTPTEAPDVAATASARPALASGARPALVSNAVKYRDNGGKPATGRSGNAVVNVLAMLDREGTTTLSVTTRHATDWWRFGYITRAQVKASTPDGKLRFTRNLNGYAEVEPYTEPPPDRFTGELFFKGLGRGDRVQVQANVEGYEGERTEVVTVTETVKRIPDLRVEMAAPAEVRTGTPVNVVAVVSEVNGDMGTYAVCDLYVAGQHADQAQGAWVDAGDAVTCAMTWSFASPGTFPVEVRVSTGSREWDTGNNADSVTIQVNGEAPRFQTSASFTQAAHVDSILRVQSWRDGRAGLAGEFIFEEVNARSHQYGTMYAFMPVQIPGDLDVRASMSTGGREVTAFSFRHPNGLSCVSEYDGRAMLDFCTWMYEGEGHTHVNYSFAAGTVTYHSRNYSRMWDLITDETLSVYHWNDGYGYDWGGGLVPLGDDWSFEVRVSAPSGEHVAAHALRLERQPLQETLVPYACNVIEEPWWDYTTTVCHASSSRASFITGF
ncbi:MAG TPA: hypothetical protein VFR81_10655 [Longimicrobium sp.]|nr:hypothetical protein [Longimicrobium sp.]